MGKILMAIAATLTFLSSCNAMAYERVEARLAIAQQNEQIAAAMRKGDVQALTAFYTEDAMVLAPGRDILSGISAIREFWLEAIKSGATGLEVSTREVTDLGEMAVEVGTYVLKDTKGTTLDHGKFIVIWKHVDREWRLHRDIFNSSVARPAPQAAN